MAVETNHCTVGDVICMTYELANSNTSQFDRERNWPEGEYVVVRAQMEGGGTGQGPGDEYPDGWHVTAKRLRNSGQYDNNGYEISFYQSGCFSGLIPWVTVVKKVKLRWVTDGNSSRTGKMQPYFE